MDDDFDNEMGLPEDELTGSTSMSDPADLGLGGMDAEDEMDSEAPGRPSGGARARGASASRPRKKAKKKSSGRAKKKTAKKSARKASRKPMRKAAKKASAGRKRKAGRKR